MPKLERHIDNKATKQRGKPDPAALVLQGVNDWLLKRGQHSLPAPCQPDPVGCVRWWLDFMQEPEHPGETYLSSMGGSGDAQNWIEGYAIACREALLAFLDMEPIQRTTIVAGVMEDHVPYRGESFRFYLRVHEETLAAREQGMDKYREKAKAKRQRFIAAMGGAQ